MLTVVKPNTLIRWHRQGWRLFWRWKSRPGRPPIPVDLRRLIITMARANPTWGEERIADELFPYYPETRSNGSRGSVIIAEESAHALAAPHGTVQPRWREAFRRN